MANKHITYFTLWRIDNKGARPIISRSNVDYNTRKEATLAAIDAALNYLIKNNE